MNAAQVRKLLDEAAKEFDQLDLNGDGSVSREELQKIAKRQSGAEGMNEEDINEFFATYDANGDGFVSK